MTHERFRNMTRFAEILGIRTLGELSEYKQRNKIRMATELYMSLYRDALAAKNAPSRNIA